METTHGSAQFATNAELGQAGFLDREGIPLGYRQIVPMEAFKHGNNHRVGYNGDQHILTVAPTRSGKGTCAIIPALLEHPSGVFCIDPKGENAIITAKAREKVAGQRVHILDPWNLACGTLGCEQAQFNPLDILKPDSDDLADDALMVADALVMPTNTESFWVDEARAMIMGFILYLVCSPDEEGQRTLGRLREILSFGPDEFMEVRDAMCAMTDVRLVRDAGNRIKQKSERELASVISTAQQNTHFLEGQKIRKSLARSTFDFADLKHPENPITVFLVLPSDRLKTHGRWLRLLVSMALTAMVRTAGKPKPPALFILDEFAALGKLAIVEQAYGLMGGYGMTLWAHLQDLSQLKTLYKDSWETFIANSGVLQTFGTRDAFTADYLSRLCGQTTIERISEFTAKKRKGGFFLSPKPNYSDMRDQLTSRRLILPEEIAKIHKDLQLLLLTRINPVIAYKIPYFHNGQYFDDQRYAIFEDHPEHKNADYKFNMYDEKTVRRFQDARKADFGSNKNDLRRSAGGGLLGKLRRFFDTKGDKFAPDEPPAPPKVTNHDAWAHYASIENPTSWKEGIPDYSLQDKDGLELDESKGTKITSREWPFAISLDDDYPKI